MVQRPTERAGLPASVSDLTPHPTAAHFNSILYRSDSRTQASPHALSHHLLQEYKSSEQTQAGQLRLFFVRHVFLAASHSCDFHGMDGRRPLREVNANLVRDSGPRPSPPLPAICRVEFLRSGHYDWPWLREYRAHYDRRVPDSAGDHDRRREHLR